MASGQMRLEGQAGSGPCLRLEAPGPLQPGQVGGSLGAGEPALALQDGCDGLRDLCRQVLGVAAGGQEQVRGRRAPGREPLLPAAPYPAR